MGGNAISPKAGIKPGHHLQSLSKVGAADMREMPTKPRRRGANHDALMVSAPRFANTEVDRASVSGRTQS